MSIQEKCSNLSIRPVESGDLNQLVHLIAELAACHGDAAVATVDTLKRDLFGWSRCLHGVVADEDRQLVGYALYFPVCNVQRAERGLDLTHLYVVSHARGRGIGSRLIDAVAAEARSRACAFVAIGTAAENRIAQNFYAKRFGAGRLPGPRFRVAV